MAAAGVMAVAIGWRVLARFVSVPCPSQLSWLVDNRFFDPLTERTLRQLDLSPGMQVLDAGCGPGRMTIPIARGVGRDGRVVALDIQADMLRRVEAKAREAALTNISLLRGGLGTGVLPAGTFDRAVLVTVLGEIPDRDAALREIYASLKPGGFLLVAEFVADPHYQSLGKVQALAARAGFRPSTSSGNWVAYSVRLEKS